MYCGFSFLLLSLFQLKQIIMKKVKLLLACICFIVLSCTKENTIMPQNETKASNQRIKSTLNGNTIYTYDGYVCWNGYCTGIKCRLGSGGTCKTAQACECVGARYPNLTEKEIDELIKSLPVDETIEELQ